VTEWTEPGFHIEGPVTELPWLIYCDRA
jgi:ribonuclease HI